MHLPKLRSIIVFVLIFFVQLATSPSVFAEGIGAYPQDDQGGDTTLYANHKITITQTFCEPLGDRYAVLTDSRNYAQVGGLDDPDHDTPPQEAIHENWDKTGTQEKDDGTGEEERKWSIWELNQVEKKDIVFTKPGKYRIDGKCCAANYVCNLATGSTTLDIVDPASVQPDELKDTPGACEICHPDWPEYNGQEADANNRCYSRKETRKNQGVGLPDVEIGYGQYKKKPIDQITCAAGYVCSHTAAGCVLPTGGLERPPLPCKRGIKYVTEAVPIGGGVAIPKEVETTDLKEIDKCLEFETGVGGIQLDIGKFVGSMMGILLSISGMIALYLIIRSGYQLMTSRGNPEAIQEARERLVSAVVGLLFIIFSLVIVTMLGVELLKIPGFS